ncbi:uncharacterized protein [Choristoneura fumiferana]|uniref:uncharacterized protein n=1 Tax=Choristoneura fumiferana TaxID=7141 RepID=UPI003D15A8C8
MGNCIGKLMSNVIYMSEKFSMWFSICSLVTCVILCLVCMLCFGIGLGYNYSYVDHKTRHTYVAGMMKKTRPTGYYGPGYFKPTTQNNSNRLTQKVVYRVSEEPETIEVIKYPPEDVPTENAMGLMKAEVAPRMRLPDPFAGPALTDLYFKGFRTLLPTGGHRYVRKFNNFNVSTPSLSVKNETEANGDIANKSSNKLHHINTTEEYSGPEAIRVDIKKVTNVDNSSISKTIMSLRQLLGFLKILRKKKTKFSVQVITL